MVAPYRSTSGELDRDESRAYLAPSATIDFELHAVARLVRELKLAERPPLVAAQLSFEWVRDVIGHSFDVGSRELPCTASQVLETGSGLCFAKSHLLAALLRSRGIPAGFGYQRLRNDETSGGHSLHGFAYFYHAPERRFVPLDPRGNNDVVFTEFDLRRPSLAYDPDAALGERTLEAVYVEPLDVIVRFLAQHDDLDEVRHLIPDLPGSDS